MGEMYVWEVGLEVEWKYIAKNLETGKSKTFNDVDGSEKFTVAAPSGILAIEKAKKISLDKRRGYTDDWSSSNEVVSTIPIKVLDVISLTLKETLDG